MFLLLPSGNHLSGSNPIAGFLRLPPPPHRLVRDCVKMVKRKKKQECENAITSDKKHCTKHLTSPSSLTVEMGRAVAATAAMTSK